MQCRHNSLCTTLVYFCRLDHLIDVDRNFILIKLQGGVENGARALVPPSPHHWNLPQSYCSSAGSDLTSLSSTPRHPSKLSFLSEVLIARSKQLASAVSVLSSVMPGPSHKMPNAARYVSYYPDTVFEFQTCIAYNRSGLFLHVIVLSSLMIPLSTGMKL